jgi:phosphoribosylformimino-5-aminoimidazole carboxamide ribotide isomerase
VTFQVIPAIDVSEGRLCRLGIGGPVVVDEFDGDPVAAARAFAAAGASRVHVVDLDLAFAGTLANVAVVSEIAALPVAVQASGGVAREAHAQALLDAGAERVVLGSAALAERRVVETMIDRFGPRLVIGIETEGSRIRPRGRDRPIELGLRDTLSWLAGTSAERFLHTNVRRVGELAGPDLDGLTTVLSAKRPVIAAGGIAGLDDLLAVRAAGAEAAVVGRAVIEGTLDLAAALRVLG